MGLEVKSLVSSSTSKKALMLGKYISGTVVIFFFLFVSSSAYTAEIGGKAKVSSQPEEETKRIFRNWKSAFQIWNPL